MLKPSVYFKDMIKTIWRMMMFKHGKFDGAFLWVFCWVLPFTVFGWYLADVSSNNK